MDTSWSHVEVTDTENSSSLQRRSRGQRRERRKRVMGEDALGEQRREHGAWRWAGDSRIPERKKPFKAACLRGPEPGC